VLAREIGVELLSRLDWMTLQPKQILDVGCGTGELNTQLKKRYPQAEVIGIDLSAAMIDYAKKNVLAANFMQADGAQLPFTAQSVDLIVAHFLLPWQADIKPLLQEWLRVLRPHGVLLATAFGPDTLKEWHNMSKDAGIINRIDMHDLGDLLLQLGLVDPVVEVENIIVSYRDPDKMIKELQITGMIDAEKTFSLDAAIAPYDLSYEVIYMHAFAPVTKKSDGTVKVPLSNLRDQLKKKD